jgi:hypothetical protein
VRQLQAGSKEAGKQDAERNADSGYTNQAREEEMTALQKLVYRCNEMDITEQLNWLGDASMPYQAQLELAAQSEAIEAAKEALEFIVKRGVVFDAKGTWSKEVNEIATAALAKLEVLK